MSDNPESEVGRQPDLLLPARPAGSNSRKEAFAAAMMTAEFFAGPLPPPHMLARYNEVIPGGAARILSMAEKQADHRARLEEMVVRGNVARQREGSYFAFIIAMTVIGGGIYLLATGRNIEGLAAIVAALASLTAVFVASKASQRKERIEKAKILEERRESAKSDPQPG